MGVRHRQPLSHAFLIEMGTYPTLRQTRLKFPYKRSRDQVALPAVRKSGFCEPSVWPLGAL